jgi:thiol-disulfide isomerase/thioredoxin
MNRVIVGALPLLLVCVIPAFAQSTDLPPAMQLLTQVTQKYAEAQNYYIKAIERDTYSGEFDGGWTRKILIASEMDRRFHFETQTGAGNSVAIADGNAIWVRHSGERVYASMPESDQALKDTIRGVNQDEQIKQARQLRASLAKLARNVAEADFLPEQSFARGDRLIRSRVIVIRESKQGSAGIDASGEKNVWIDEDEGKILKIVERKTVPAHSPGGAKDVEITTTFETMFDPPDCLFSAEVPDEASNGATPLPPHIVNPLSLVGKKLPDLRFKSADGTLVTLDSLRGKPLLIDFWATWCAPCIASLPELADIYDQARGKGLTFLAVDQDKDPRTGFTFLQRKGYMWPDFTDPDGEVHKQMGYEGLPHLILVDSTGTIVFDGTGENARELRSSIARLGSEFRSLVPESGLCAVPR